MRLTLILAHIVGLRAFMVIAMTIGTTACQKNDFPDYNQLGGLRLLTIKALSDGAEVSPGTTVTLQPVVSDLNGGGRLLSVNVQACVDPGIGFGAQAACANPDSNANSSFSSTTLGSNGTYTGAAPSFSISVPSVTLKSPTEMYNGLGYLVVYTISASDGASVTSFKRIVISDPSKAAKNKNPAIASVSANGSTLSTTNAFSGATLNLSPTFSVGAENYQTLLPDGTFSNSTESLTTTWFITDGTMKYERTFGTDTNQWQPSKPTSRGATIVLISHDGRGGEDYQIFEFN